MDTSKSAVSAEPANMTRDRSNDSYGRRRKRRNSSISSPGDATRRPSTRSLTRSNTRTNAQIAKDEYDTQTRDVAERSRKPKKRVRFSDPGPSVRIDEGNSTGLTPAVRRTSLQGTDISSQDAVNTMPQTPSGRSRRRRSAPTPRNTASPSLASSSTPRPWIQEFQFPVLSQQLDERTQRRIRRVGLSEEMNSIEQGKRSHMKREKDMLKEKDMELVALKEELKAARSIKSEDEEMVLDGNEDGNSVARRRIEELEAEVERLKGEIAMSGASQYNNDEPMSSYESTDTVLISDNNINDTILVSTSPDRQYHGDVNSALIPSPSPTDSPTSRMFGERSTPTTPDFQKEAEIFALSLDLEAAKQEKLELFNEWRSHVSSGAIPSPDPSELSRLSSPPPDFMAQVTTTLRAAISRASDATLALDILREDLSGLGFPGPSTDAIIAEMRSRFREARMELERAVPGETPNASLDDGNATLHALVERIKSLVQDVKEGQEKLAGSTDREKALRGQFDACLAQSEVAANKMSKLEETIENTADDMLHSRMRIQELEKEGKDQAFGIERLNNALEKYREEIKELEVLITTLESEHNESTTASNKTISNLESKVLDEGRARREAESLAEEHRVSVNNLQETLAQNNTQITNLTSTVDSLKNERDSVLAEMDRKTTEQAELHDRQTGSLNAKLGQLTTSLADANSQVDRLREANTRLEHRVSVEADAFVRATEEIQAENAKTFARIKELTSSSLRGVKVRKANAELEDEDCTPYTPKTNVVGGGGGRRKTASFAPIGSEPITPSSGGSRFVDVEVGRGKKRKRLDSGIGIGVLEEEEEEDGDGGEGDSGIGQVELNAMGG